MFLKKLNFIKPFLNVKGDLFKIETLNNFIKSNCFCRLTPRVHFSTSASYHKKQAKLTDLQNKASTGKVKLYPGFQASLEDIKEKSSF